MPQQDIQFAQGIFFLKPGERAPEYILGNLSIRPNDFIEWLNCQTPDETGYIRLVVKNSKNNKAYIALDTWKKKPQEAMEAYPHPADDF